MSVPDNLRYSSDHEWVRIDGDVAYIGITDFAQSQLGDIVFVELPEIGGNFSSGEVFGTVEAVKTVADLFAPISCEIIDINSQLDSSPESINSDVYNDGWIVKVKINNPDELSMLLDSKAYKGMIS